MIIIQNIRIRNFKNKDITNTRRRINVLKIKISSSIIKILLEK